MKDSGLKLIFVHLGESKADHLWLNLVRHVQMFPNLDTVVIIDDKRHLSKIPEGIDIFFYQRDFKSVNWFLKSHELDHAFRNGFWRFSLERIFALIEFHEQVPNSVLIHMESDVLTFPNFPWQLFAQISKLSWGSYDGTKDVASIILMPNQEASIWLRKRLLEELEIKPSHSDMTILSAISNNFPDKISTVPIVTSQISTLLNKGAHIEQSVLDKNQDSAKYFGGIFDTAVIGMWLTGMDPRNSYGFTKYGARFIIDSDRCFVDPSNVKFSLGTEGNLRIIAQDKEIELFCLHVHSKNLQLFSSKWDVELERLIIRHNGGIFKSEFSLRILKELLISNFNQGSLIPFIIGIPRLKRIRVFLKYIQRIYRSF